jgi:biopolymer transport protein ExbD
MRLPSRFHSQRGGVELQLTPLIDCVFLLLVYFLWSASFAVAERSLPGQILDPTSGESVAAAGPPLPEDDFDKIIVHLLWQADQPGWTVNGVAVASLAELRRTLSSIARIHREVPIVVDPAHGVPLGDVIDAFDAARLAGFAKVQLAVTDGSP